jgi:hypothetical protein
MKEQILSSNTHIKATDIVVSGNPSFDRFFQYQPFHTKDYYAKKYKFDLNRPIILYSMISPKAYEGEKDSIELINKRLIEQYPEINHRPIIILRRNPIDETEANEEYFSGDNVRYADNYFESSYDNAVFVQLNEGEIEWMDLLYHAHININVASTVTLEALMSNTPVINIEFDSTGEQNKHLSRYANAPFYQPLHGRKDVAIVQNIDECMEVIHAFLYEEVTIEKLYPILEYFDGKATQRILKEIDNG